MNKQQTVKGTQAQHSIEIQPLKTWADYDTMVADYRASTLVTMQSWSPENGAVFTNLGAATRWLKTLLGKNGWPVATRWVITQDKVGDGPVSFSIFLA